MGEIVLTFEVVSMLFIILFTLNLEKNIKDYISSFKDESLEMDDFTLQISNIPRTKNQLLVREKILEFVEKHGREEFIKCIQKLKNAKNDEEKEKVRDQVNLYFPENPTDKVLNPYPWEVVDILLLKKDAGKYLFYKNMNNLRNLYMRNRLKLNFIWDQEEREEIIEQNKKLSE
jgi:hypothetical protein